MADVLNLHKDMEEVEMRLKKLIDRAPVFIAGAAERMKDANFSAEGFVTDGRARKWRARKWETPRTAGKRILHGTGYLRNNVKSKASGRKVVTGVDLNIVPYARILGEGGRKGQYVRPFTRTRNGRREQVRAFFRRLNVPARPYIGYSPDILKIAGKELRYEFDRIFKNQ